MNKLTVGPITGGLTTNVLPFNIDNESFPVLVNAFQWRKRLRRKRGTSLLGRLTRYFDSLNPVYGSITTITVDAAGNQNLLTGFGLETTGNIVIGSLLITDTINGRVYNDLNLNGELRGVPNGQGFIDYGTGAFMLSSGSFGNPVSATFLYTPDLPVMGLEEFNPTPESYPGTIAFDTVYSYNISTISPYVIYDVSFYKNPDLDGTNLPGYAFKALPTPTRWTGQDYQQFYTLNYQGAMWATNGINIPFNSSTVGMQFKPIVTVTPTSAGPPAIVTLEITDHGLVEGDFLFINEVVTTTGINFQTGYVIDEIDDDHVSVEFPNATITNIGTGGIAQYLTNRANTTIDCIRWYDGDPTDNSDPLNPTFVRGKGWVNFMPPLSFSNFSISGTRPRQYYLVGARLIQEFKDRLLFIGPVIQAATGAPIYLPDTVVFSQNGTPYYTASFTGDPTLSTTIYSPILVPDNQAATPNAYWEDQTGFGGSIPAGVDEAITTAEPTEDVLIMGLNTIQARFVYTGNDLVPFNFYLIDSQFSTTSTFSAISMGDSVITRGSRGIINTSQRECNRIDLPILDQNFQISSTQNGAERFTAQRDFLNEYIYFTYRSNQNEYRFPSQTLFYNYRDNTWAIFDEAYTTYGQFRKRTGFTWATVGRVYPTWASWTVPWNSGASTLLTPEVIAGNQEGFVLIRDEGTNEGESLPIFSIAFPTPITGATQAVQAVLTSTTQLAIGQRVTISGVVGMTQLNGNTYTVVNVTFGTVTLDVNSTLFGAYVSGGTITPVEQVYIPNHTLNDGDYFVISGAVGPIASRVNGKIFSVQNAINNGFRLNPSITSSIYRGGGLIKRMYVPFIQTRQFPVSWDMGRKTRIGVQKYLLSTTDKGQIQLLIYLSQNASSEYENYATAYNVGNIVPQSGVINNSLIYSTVLYTCLESTNLGLTKANTNLQMISDGSGATGQKQIWHRINTSLIGDTIQLGFTMSDSQMRDTSFRNQFVEIELHGFQLDVYPSQLLC